MNHHDGLRVWESIRYSFQGVSIVDGGATLGDPYIPPTSERLDPAEEVNAAVALVLRIDSLGLTWFWVYRQQHVADELARLLVKADDRLLGVERTFVHVQYIL